MIVFRSDYAPEQAEITNGSRKNGSQEWEESDFVGGVAVGVALGGVER